MQPQVVLFKRQDEDGGDYSSQRKKLHAHGGASTLLPVTNGQRVYPTKISCEQVAFEFGEGVWFRSGSTGPAMLAQKTQHGVGGGGDSPRPFFLDIAFLNVGGGSGGVGKRGADKFANAIQRICMVSKSQCVRSDRFHTQDRSAGFLSDVDELGGSSNST